MKKQFLIRLDDACPTMDTKKWGKIEQILDKHGIAPMVGIVPHCEDEKLQICPKDSNFWNKAQKWRDKDWAIALHGYNHVYSSFDAGINPLWNRSEFAGIPFEVQRQKIRDGINIFKRHGLDAKYFFAPSHTYDLNTLEALKQESNIRIISDTIGLEIYKEHNFTFVPCQLGHFMNVPFDGLWTFCFHPNTMNDNQIKDFDKFILTNRHMFSSWGNFDFNLAGKKSLKSRLISWLYFTNRKIRGIQ